MLGKLNLSLNIRARMLLLCLGVALPLLAIGSFSLWKQYGTLKDESKRATGFQAAIASRTLNQWTLSQLRSVQALSNLPRLSGHDAGDREEILETALASHQRDWNEIALIDRNGIPISVQANQGESIKSASAGFLDQALLKKAAEYRHAVLSDFTRSPWTEKAGLFAISPVTEEGSLTGFLVAGIKPDAVLSVFNGLSKQHGTVITVVDGAHRVVARTLENEYWEGKDFSHSRCVEAAAKADSGSIETVGIADPTPRAYAFEKAEPNGWLVIVGVPTNTIYGGAYQWFTLLIALSLGAIAVSLVLAYLVTNHFTRTINILVKEALAVGKGDFTKRVNVTARDELGTLARAFNTMAEMLLFDKEQKNMVQRISLSVRQSLNLNDILNTAVKELGENLQASRCCLALLDTHGTIATYDDELVFDYVWCDESTGGDQLRTRCVPITGNSALRTILDQGTTMSLDVLDDRSSPIFDDDKLAADDWKSIKSLIACPISTSQGVLGMILVHQCDRRRIWSPYELELVEAVAGQVTVAMEHARLYDRTKRMAEQEMLINHIVRSVRGSLDLDTILGTVTRELLHAARVDRVQIVQPRSEDPLVVTHEYTVQGYEKCVDLCMYPENMDFSPAERRRRPSGIRNTVLGINLDGLIDREDNEEAPDKDTESLFADQATTMHEAPIAVINDTGKDSRCIPFKAFLDTVNSRALIAAPLLHENRLVGLLVVHQCASTREWNTSDVQLVTSIANHLAIAVTHAQLYAQVRHQAITDGLTGLYNHVYFKNRLEEELRMADRKGTSCSLIMIDLDKLKYINDNYGHPVGDAAIRQVASILKTVLRSGDTAARYGGEEFAVILPETSLLEAALIADRLCTRIRSSQVPGLGQITASLGASSYPKQARTPEELINNADKALYLAKNGGRDQARIYEEPETIDLPAELGTAELGPGQTSFAPDEARSQSHQ